MPILNRLRSYREARQLLQADVARALGLASIDRISSWAQGQTFPHILSLFKLAQLYQVSPQELYPELNVELERAMGSEAGLNPRSGRTCRARHVRPPFKISYVSH